MRFLTPLFIGLLAVSATSLDTISDDGQPAFAASESTQPENGSSDSKEFYAEEVEKSDIFTETSIMEKFAEAAESDKMRRDPKLLAEATDPDGDIMVTEKFASAEDDIAGTYSAESKDQGYNDKQPCYSGSDNKCEMCPSDEAKGEYASYDVCNDITDDGQPAFAASESTQPENGISNNKEFFAEATGPSTAPGDEISDDAKGEYASYDAPGNDIADDAKGEYASALEYIFDKQPC